MNITEVSLIPEAAQRLAQAQRFLRNVERTEWEASRIRNAALIELREEGMSQQAIADLLGVTQQRVSQMEVRALLFLNIEEGNSDAED